MFCFNTTPTYRVIGNCVTRAICHLYLRSFYRNLAFHRFSIATTNQLNRSVFSISVSDVDLDFSLRLKNSEVEEENGVWSSGWVFLIFCDYKLIVSKLCSFFVSYIYFSKVKA